MKVCPKCWTRYHDDKSICRHCRIKLHKPEEMSESKVDPHFRVIKDQTHRIHSVHRDKVSHEIMKFDEKGHHEYHSKGSFLKDKDMKTIMRLLIAPVAIIAITIIVMVIVVILLRNRAV